MCHGTYEEIILLMTTFIVLLLLLTFPSLSICRHNINKEFLLFLAIFSKHIAENYFYVIIKISWRKFGYILNIRFTKYTLCFIYNYMYVNRLFSFSVDNFDFCTVLAISPRNQNSAKITKILSKTDAFFVILTY